MANPPFSNSMEDDNYPDAGGAKSGVRDVVHDGMPDLSSGGSAGDERPIQDNGTQGKTFSVGVGGQPSETKVDYPLPKDPHAPPGPDAGDRNDDEISDYGLNESVEVGHKGNFQSDYGISGPPAGGGITKANRNTRG